MSMVFQNFLKMVHDNTGGVWGENVDTIYAALILDGGSSPFDRSWKTMTDLTSRGWNRALPDTGDIQVLNGVRTQAYQQSNTGSQFAQYSMVYKLNGQLNFGIKTEGQNLRCVIFYWDTDGNPANDNTNEILFMDDENVNSAVTSTGNNIWGSAGLNEVAAIQCTNIVSLYSYIMEAGVTQMHNEADLWENVAGTRSFIARLFQSTTTAVDNPSAATTLTDVPNPRAIAQAGGDIGDITIFPTQRSITWDTNFWKWRFQIDPGGTALNFGTCAAGQTVGGVAIADAITGNIWYWDNAMAGQALASPTQITYGPSTEFTAFSFRAQTA